MKEKSYRDVKRSMDLDENESRISEIKNILERKGYGIVVLKYPSQRRSVDIVVDKKALIKISGDSLDIRDEEYHDLLASGALLGLSSLVVSERIEGEKVEPGIIFEKKGVSVVDTETFLGYVGGEKIFIYQWRGSFYVKIDGERLRREREKKGMSIGEVAERIGVSRKTIYEYERGLMDPDIDHAEKLIEILGEEIIGEIDLFTERLYNIDKEKLLKKLMMISSREDKIVKRIIERGASAIKTRRTAPDIIGVFRNNLFTITKISSHEINNAETITKISDALKFSRYTGCKPYIVADIQGDISVDEVNRLSEVEVVDIKSIEKYILSDLSR
ncbi:MAG: helix-turn-helix domain-containing protein [Sulfolobales archaeon]